MIKLRERGYAHCPQDAIDNQIAYEKWQSDKEKSLSDRSQFIIDKMTSIFGENDYSKLLPLVNQQKYLLACELGFQSNEWDVCCVLVDGQYENDEQLLRIKNQ